jgi:hypothetical protein
MCAGLAITLCCTVNKHMLQLEEEVRSTCCSRKKSEKDMLQLEEEVQSIHMCRVGQNLVLHS